MTTRAVPDKKTTEHYLLSDSELLDRHDLLDLDTTREGDLDLVLRLIRLLAGL